jgi:glyoxylase-like metal-dependent hydrolase (beta-lactamase superfamily II)
MPGGTEYILHDIDENNFIVGKARFSGNVKVSESMSVDGFGGKSMLDIDTEDENDDLQEHDSADSECSTNFDRLLDKKILPPTFHPPSFGVTILGNSHGFDKSGSTSGYVLWINGRGVMIDPPPYSSATLEREGIRPRTIVGIIVTHCHADHDAGAFQKVLTGSPVVVITTPTIYKSFIRKYAALSALSPALLRHSHRHKPAIIGTPLRFQGATFHFTYTLHTIPCIGFRVEWRGRSMVFTGDHFNYPPAIDKLQESVSFKASFHNSLNPLIFEYVQGVLSKARADDLRNLPLQEADLLLHEAGAPPIHTPLDVLMKLPEKVKKRMYVVHTSALPEGCDLRVAPTGTAGTIRLDRMRKVPIPGEPNFRFTKKRSSRSIGEDDIADFDGNIEFHSTWATVSNEYGAVNDDLALDGNSSDPRLLSSTAANLEMDAGNEKQTSRRSNSFRRTGNLPPLVSLRPSSSTDAWFILNLLSAVPFLTSLSYASTMEVLETARVDAYCKDEIIVSTSRRNHVLCVVWEGTCVEKYQDSPVKDQVERSSPSLVQSDSDVEQISLGVWHAGDWTGPIALQPDKRLSGESTNANTHDIVAMSMEGVKV